MLTIDNEVRALGLSLPATIQEDTSATATVTIPGYLAAPLIVHLSSSEPNLASVPATVTIPSGATSNTFTITLHDNSTREGSRNVMITADAETFTSVSAVTTIRDNEIAGYSVGVATDIVDISGPVPFTVSTTDVEGNVISGSAGTVNVFVLQSDGSLQAASPPTLALTGRQTTGAITLLPNLSVPLRIRVTDPMGNSGESRPFDYQRVLSLTAADLVWDSARQRIYASIPSNAPTYANQVLAIDPVTLQITGSLTVGQNPGQMALTSGGEALYVALNANGSIARVDPQTMSIVSTFSLGSSGSQGAYFAKDLCTVVGQPNLVLVLRATAPLSPSSPGILTAYDNGVARPNTISPYQLEPSSEPGIVYVQASYSGDVARVQLNANGVTSLQTGATGYVYSGSMVADEMTITSGGGYLIDGTSLRLAGRFPFESYYATPVPRPDSAKNRVYFVLPKTSDYNSQYASIASYDSKTLSQIRRSTMPELAAAPASFIRWGSNGLAYRTTSTVVLVNAAELVPSEASADINVSLKATPSSAPAAAPVSFNVQLTNNGPNTARSAMSTVSLSDGQTLTSVNAVTGTFSIEGNIVRFFAGNLASGSSASLTLTTSPSPSAGSVSCTAIGSSNSFDPDFHNDAAFKLVPIAFRNTQGLGQPTKSNRE